MSHLGGISTPPEIRALCYGAGLSAEGRAELTEWFEANPETDEAAIAAKVAWIANIEAGVDPERAERFRATTRGVSQSWDAFHAEERRMRRARRVATMPQRRVATRAPQIRRTLCARPPRSQRRASSAQNKSPSGLAGDDSDPAPRPLDLLDAALLALGWVRVAA